MSAYPRRFSAAVLTFALFVVPVPGQRKEAGAATPAASDLSMFHLTGCPTTPIPHTYVVELKTNGGFNMATRPDFVIDNWTGKDYDKILFCTNIRRATFVVDFETLASFPFTHAKLRGTNGWPKYCTNDNCRFEVTKKHPLILSQPHPAFAPHTRFRFTTCRRQKDGSCTPPRARLKGEVTDSDDGMYSGGDPIIK